MQFPKEGEKKTFIEGIITMSGAGGPMMKDGLSILVYSCNANMEREAFYSSDGDMLIVPQQGALLIKTELGRIRVEPLEICVIQRGIKFSVDVLEGQSRGYITEVFKGHFVIPDLGPIGSNGLANGRDFEIPTSWYEDTEDKWTLINKF
jgi:homogentisate 1,2-dioxygenase